MAIELQTNMMLEATPSDPKHVVHIKWVQDYLAETIKIKQPVRAAESENIDGTYDSDTGLFTLDENGRLTIDGVEMNEGDRVLLAGQDDSSENGIYVVVDPGGSGKPAVLKRADDFETPPGSQIHVEEGDKNSDKTWRAGKDAKGTTFEEVENVLTKFCVTLTGDDIATDFVIDHEIGTKDIKVSIVNEETGQVVWADVSMPDADSVKISFAVAPADGKKYRVTIIG